MNNEEKMIESEETVIPLGGETPAVPEEAPTEIEPAPENEPEPVVLLSDDEDVEKKPEKKKKKKTSKAVKVIRSILVTVLIIILILVIAVGALLFLATRDNLPAASKNEPPAFAFSMDMVEIHLFDESDATATLTEADINSLLNTFKKTFNEKNTMLSVDDLFAKIVGEDIELYARATVSQSGIELTFPAKVVLTPTYQEPHVVCYIKSIECGSLSIFPNLIDLFTKNAALPEYLSIQNGNIYYDASTLDKMIDDIIKENVSFGGGLLGSIVDASIEDIRVSDGALSVDIGVI